MIKYVRNHFKDIVVGLVPEDVLVTTEGDVSKPDAKETRIRMKVFPRETTNVTIGIGNIKEAGGLVQMDVIAPRMEGFDYVADLSADLVDGIQRGTAQLTGLGQLIVYSVWADAVMEEPAYLRVPVYIRWALLHH